MGQLYNLIQGFRNGEMDTFIVIMDKFEPQLNKFQRNSINEDMKSDLTLFMFKILSKIPLDKDIFRDDKYIFSYINKSLKHQYIHLNKISHKLMNKEIPLEDKIINQGDDNCFRNIVFEDLIKNLTDIEKNVIINKYKFNYAEAEIARMKGISRQAVHKTHIRALSKMKNLL